MFARCPLQRRNRHAIWLKTVLIGSSALAAEICAGPHHRLLRRQHCSSLCSQSEGHEHVANMVNALAHDFVGLLAVFGRHNIRPPSLCEQSEGHEHVANMYSALAHDFVGFLACVWPPQYSSPSLCEQSEGHEHVANMTNALAHDFVGFLAVFGRHNIRPPHFASKVSYSASPQTFAKCSRSAAPLIKFVHDKCSFFYWYIQIYRVFKSAKLPPPPPHKTKRPAQNGGMRKRQCHQSGGTICFKGAILTSRGLLCLRRDRGQTGSRYKWQFRDARQARGKAVRP